MDQRWMKLGKDNPRFDRRTLRIENYVDVPSLPPSPPARSWNVPLPCGEMGNADVGDCTCAAAGHLVQVWTYSNGGEITIPDPDILYAYSAVSGYVPGDDETDHGANMLDVLNFWRQTGIGGHKILAYASINTQNRAMMAAVVNLFGGVYLGLGLPVSAQNQALWTVGTGDSAVKYSWGGHCTVINGYNIVSQIYDILTWGERLPATYQFVEGYSDEGYVLLSEDWVAHGKSAPSGFDVDALKADLTAVTA
jgi:hypothetical protein